MSGHHHQPSGPRGRMDSMKRLVPAVVVAMLATGCRPAPPVASQSTGPPVSPSPSAPTVHMVTQPDRFTAAVAAIDRATRARMVSWRPGCPVPIEELRLIHLTYWGFDGVPHRGELVVNRRVADAVV